MKCSYRSSLPPIDNRSMLHHYTQEVSHIAEFTYRHVRWTTLINHRSMLHCYTQDVSHIAECTYTHVRCTPQLTIDLCYTSTPKKFHIQKNDTYTHGRQTLPSNRLYIHVTPLHPIGFTYSRMHIYPWWTDPPNDHTSMLHHNTP